MKRIVEVHDPSRAADVERWFRGEVQGVVIKQNSGRTVWRLPVGIYAKRFAPTFLRDRARKEAGMLRTLGGAGIPCPRLVATARDDSGSFLLTEEIADAENLDDLVEKGVTRTLIVALAKLLRRLHDANIDHEDFHAGNVLVRRGELFVIDVHRASVTKLSKSRRLDAVAFTMLSLSERVTLGELARFARVYGVDPRDVCPRLKRRRLQYYRGREKRCFEEGSGFGVLGSVLYRKGVALEPLLKWVESGEKTAVKESGARGLYRSKDLFLKKTRHARTIWGNSHALSIRRIPTPRLDACGPGWVVGEWVDAPDLYWHVKKEFPSMSRAGRNDAVQQLARLVRRMHDYGVFHADLKAGNVIVRDRYLIVDLDRVRFTLDVPMKDRRFNLAQLNASVVPPLTKSDRLRFLLYYLGRDRSAWREWGAAVMKITRERKHHWP